MPFLIYLEFFFMAILMTAEAEGLTAETYTEMRNALKVLLVRAPGLILHTAHATPTGGYRVIELWQSKQESDQFFAQHVAPNLPPGLRPKRHTVDLESLVTPTEASQ
jgi:hypothetical protein